MEPSKTSIGRGSVVAAALVCGLLVAGDLRAQGTQAPPPTQGTTAGAAQAPAAPPARARQGQGRGREDAEAPPISLIELQRLFDAYFIIQAQDALNIDDAKFTDILPRLKALQDVRRRHDQERRQAVGALAKLTAPAAVIDEAQVRDKLRALQELESRAAADLRKAYDAIDQGLDVRQQARFRVFEQNMERRKLELMLRARRAQTPGAAGPGR
jgi:hypothetical protein